MSKKALELLRRVGRAMDRGSMIVLDCNQEMVDLSEEIMDYLEKNDATLTDVQLVDEYSLYYEIGR